MLSNQEESQFAGLLPYLAPLPDTSAATQAPPAPTLIGRAGEQLANLPSNMLSGVLNMGKNILETGTPDEDRLPDISVPAPYTIPTAKSVGESLVDTGAGIASQLPAYLIPELGVTRFAEAAGAGEVASRMIGGAASGAINNPDAPISNALLLGAAGGASVLPRMSRVLPQLAIGGTAAGLTYAQTGDTTAASINGGVMGLLGMLPGAHAGEAPTRVEEKNAEAAGVPPATTQAAAPDLIQPAGVAPPPMAPPTPGTLMGGVGTSAADIDASFPLSGKSAAESASVFPAKSAQESALDIMSQQQSPAETSQLQLQNPPATIPMPAATVPRPFDLSTDPELPLGATQPATPPNAIVPPPTGAQPELPIQTLDPHPNSPTGSIYDPAQVQATRQGFPNSQPVPAAMQTFADHNNLAYNGGIPDQLHPRTGEPMVGYHMFTMMDPNAESSVALMNNFSPEEAQAAVNKARSGYGLQELPEIDYSEKGNGDTPPTSPQRTDVPTKDVETSQPSAKADDVPEPPATQTDSPPKAVAALGGDSNPLSADVSHLSEPDQEDVQYWREKYQESVAPDAAENGYTPDAPADYLSKIKTLLSKNSAGEAQDSPKLIQLRNSKYELSTGSVLRAGDIETSQSPLLYGGHEDAVSSLDAAGDESEKLGNNDDPPVSFSDDPAKNDIQNVNKIMDSLGLEDNDPAGGDREPTAAELAETEEALNGAQAKSSGDVSSTKGEQVEKIIKTADKAKPRTAKALKNAARRVKANREGGFVGFRSFGDRQAAPYISRSEDLFSRQTAKYVLGTLARYSPGIIAGGTTGAYLDKEDRLQGFILGGIGGGLVHAFGMNWIKMMMEDMPKSVKANIAHASDVYSLPGSRTEDFLNNMAAEDHSGHQSAMTAFVRRTQQMLSRSEDAREVFQSANVNELSAQAEDAINSMRSDYGRLTDEDKARITKFAESPREILDPATGKMVTDTLAVPRFMADMSDHPQVAAGFVLAREIRMKQQDIIANSTALGALRNSIQNSIGKYHTDMYRIFTSNEWKPSSAMIDKAVDSMKWLGMFPKYDDVLLRKYVTTHLEGIYKNRALYEGGAGGEASGTFDGILKGKGSLPEALEKKILAAVPGAKSVDEIVTSQLALPSDLRTQLADQIGSGNYVTPAYRDMLGLYKDPMERDVATMMKLMPAVRAAKLFDSISRGKNSLGMPMAIDPEDEPHMRAELKAQLQTATDPKVQNLLQRKLLDLRQRVFTDSTDNLGVLSHKLVSPDIADVLPNAQRGLYGGNTLPVGRAVMEITRAIKAGQTVLNPVSHIRWLYNAPLLGSLAGNNPFDIANGFRVALGKGDYAAINRRLVNLGVIEDTISRSDFNLTTKRALSGSLDQSLLDRFISQPLVSKIVDSYGISDNAIRGATFLKREQQILTRLAPDIAAGRVTSQDAAAAAEKEAIRYTNRYTVSYSNVPGGLSYMSKMPFVSIYLTYGYETARITKNIVMDAMGRGPYGKEAQAGAIAKLVGMSVIPAAIQAGARAMLSPQDQDAWDKSRKMQQPYAQPRLQVPLWRNQDGSFKYLDMTAWDPIGDWSTFGRAVASGDWKQMWQANPVFGSDNTPALNIANEIISGTNQHTGRPINTVGRALDAARQDIAPAFVGGYEFDNLMRALQPNEEGGIGITRMGSGKGYSIGDLVATYLTGLRPTNVNPKWQERTVVQNATSQIATEKQFLMDTLQSDMTQDVKQMAVKRYGDAVKVIVANLQQKLGIMPQSN